MAGTAVGVPVGLGIRGGGEVGDSAGVGDRLEVGRGVGVGVGVLVDVDVSVALVMVGLPVGLALGVWLELVVGVPVG